MARGRRHEVIIVYRNKSNHADRLTFDAKSRGDERNKLHDIAARNNRKASDYELDPLYSGDGCGYRRNS